MGVSANIADAKALEDALNAVRQRFLDALYDRILVLDALVEQVLSMGPDKPQLREIAGCCHQTATEMPSPDAVHDHPRGQRMSRPGQFHGQLRPRVRRLMR